MGLIINRSLRNFFKGYPTRHPAPWVLGATLGGSASVEFGDLVKFGSEPDIYESAAGGVASVAEIAGFVLSTNVKLAEANYTTVLTKPGEQFNLIKSGYMAIELDDDAVVADVVANGEVRVILASGKCTTSSQTAGSEALPNVVFTGHKEVVGGKLLAEILVK